jgi:acyl carrier protein
MNKQELVDVILSELKVICQENGIDAANINAETVLFGSASVIDSLALVGLIIKLE